MNPHFTIVLLAAAGVALVVQNLLMVRITETDRQPATTSSSGQR
jgi:uncharacterized membrane protein YdcZ (DUF606 family)